MRVDVSGRTLIRAKEVHEENHKLCNVATAIDLTDAVNLKNLKVLEEKINGSL